MSEIKIKSLLGNVGKETKKVKEKAAKKKFSGSFSHFFLFVISPIMMFIITELFSVSKIVGVDPLSFIRNYMLFLFLHIFFYIPIRHVRLTSIIISSLVYVFGVINYFVIQSKGIPINFGDILSLKTALNVAGSYRISIDVFLFIATLVFAAYLFFVCRFIKEPKYRGSRKQRITFYSAVTSFIVVLLVVMFSTNFMWFDVDTKVWDAPRVYKRCGYLLSLCSDIKNTTDVSVDGYDPNLIDTYDKDGTLNTGKTADEDGVYPNIIAVMSESFCDIKNSFDIETNIDYMPKIRQIMEESYYSGYTAPSSPIGTGTANSEFEFLTGSSMIFLQGTRPYIQFINNDVYTLVSTLKSQKTPYSAYAVHPYDKSGYNRVKIYKYFDFDEFYSDEDFPEDSEILRRYISDDANFKYIENLYEEKKDDGPMFIFNITMQNHGSYSGEDISLFKEPVTVTNYEVEDKVNTYLSLLKVTDDAVGDLVDYYRNVDEPTIILFFGDHEPNLGQSFYELFFQDYENQTFDETIKLHKSVYFMWANYELPKKEDDIETVSFNYLGSLLLKTAGLEMTAYDRYLLDLRNNFPIINAIYYEDYNGIKYPATSLSDFGAQLEIYEMLQYNHIFDTENIIDRYFTLYDIENSSKIQVDDEIVPTDPDLTEQTEQTAQTEQTE